ncbi:LacI family DNA-binding transcriptional regulator [Marivita sp.]|uniref:LacI family DNA-binding transcriptional regulator n=1 Tax=Marivita sp. TaxID=2003365 RepID=UPI0025BD201B|nr:LacI family DNA-binding transcriptional regulator [Marivita sp.]
MGEQKRINIFIVARAAGVSPSTVSRVMNHPGVVEASTRRRVEEAIRDTGYIRNRAAQAMRGRRSATLGLIVPTVDYSIFASLVQSFGETASELGFTLLLAAHGYDLEQEYAILRKFLEHRVDGVALIGLDHTEDSFGLLASQDTPAIEVWNYGTSGPLPTVGARNDLAGALAARHLVDLGHRDIALLFPPSSDNDRSRSRQSAALSVFAAAGIDIPQERRAVSEYDIGRARLAAERLFDTPRRPTAIFCGNDVIVRGALYAALARGMRVPEDLSVMGVGDFHGSADMVPALSTVRIPAAEIGSEAARQLVGMIASDGQTAPGREFLPEVVARDTTARPHRERHT